MINWLLSYFGFRCPKCGGKKVETAYQKLEPTVVMTCYRCKKCFHQWHWRNF